MDEKIKDKTHAAETLIEIFGKPEADRILKRLRFHFTPAHASRLNMAEIEMGVMEAQCLDRRIAWETSRSDQQATIHWTFARQKARKRFGTHPSYS
ncbi:MAG: hypothetical protein ACYC6R_01035 [Anaerolineales bacterium]